MHGNRPNSREPGHIQCCIRVSVVERYVQNINRYLAGYTLMSNSSYNVYKSILIGDTNPGLIISLSRFISPDNTLAMRVSEKDEGNHWGEG
jgi:hypothetical protein